MSKILLVENDDLLSQTLQELLLAKNIQCDTASSLVQTYSHLVNRHYDLVVIDRLLDDGNGLELVGYLRDVAFSTKVLVLSQLGTSADRIVGLSDGADDYLPKPFATAEFLLRIERLLRTVKVFSQEHIRCGGIKLYHQSGMVKFDSESILLRRKEAALLHCLMSHPNQVLSREQLIAIVWSGTDAIPSYTTLDVYIRRLRIRLKHRAGVIQTVRGFGYRFAHTAHTV